MTHITTIANFKGGAMKTLMTVQLAGALARAGRRVLVVDMDPQMNATRRLGIRWDPANPFVSMAEVIKADQVGVGSQAVQPCGWVDGDGNPTVEADLIDVLPSRPDLLNRESEAGVIGAVRRLRKALEGWLEPYDVVLIDTPPSLGHLAQLGYAAADDILIPVIPEPDYHEALIRVIDFVHSHAMDLQNPELKIAGIVLTREKNGQNEHENQARAMRQSFGDQIWELSGHITNSRGQKIPVPRYLRESSTYLAADSAGTSLTAFGRSEKVRLHVEAFDALARIYISKLLDAKEKAA